MSRSSMGDERVTDVDVVREALATRAGEQVALTVIIDGGGADAAAFTLPADLDRAVAWVQRRASTTTTVSVGVATLAAAGAERLEAVHRDGRRARPRAGEHDGYAWVVADLDPHDGEDQAVLHARLERYPHPPTLLTSSGRGLHAWWHLHVPLDVAAGRQLCADLARALDGDPGAADEGRALRLAGTWNGKAGVQRRAQVLEHRPGHRCWAEDLTAAALELAPRPQPRPTAPPRRRLEHLRSGIDVAEQLREHHDLAEELDRIAGPRQQKKWRCPGGHDATASLALHRENSRRWVCFGGGHEDGLGQRARGGQWSGDVVDLLAWEAGRDVARFLADERARLAPAPSAPPMTSGADTAPAPEPPSWLEDGQETVIKGPADTTATEGGGKRTAREPSQADQLMRLAHAGYELVRSESNVFAVPRHGPRLALELRGGGGLRQHLAAAYYRDQGRAASSGALADALTTLEGEALEVDPQPVELRLATHRSGKQTQAVLDLGDASGRVILVDSHGWRVVKRSPVIFRRTALTAPLPVPQHSGHLEELRELLNVTNETWPLLVGWLVAALVPDMPHPIALLSGEQGTGKSTAGKYLVQLLDPSGVPLRSLPKDEEAWAVSAAASYVVGVDNISRITPELSDAMCRAVTGDGLVRRRLYTDSDVSVLALQRVLLLTSIDAGALRGDLAERLLMVELERIDAKGRRTARTLDDSWRAAHPRVLGALLDLVVQVMAALPRAAAMLVEHPRMADFAEVLLAVDLVRGTNGLDLYRRQLDRLARDVADSDPVAHAVLQFMEGQRVGFRGSASELEQLLRTYAPNPLPKFWPSDGAQLGRHLRRLTPALRASRVEVTHKRLNGARQLLLTHIDGAPAESDGEPLMLPGTTSGDTP